MTLKRRPASRRRFMSNNKVKKILAPTDLSELSLTGIRYALGLAKDTGAEVIVYHAVRTDEISQTQRGSDEQTLSDYSTRSPQHLLQRHMRELKRFLETNCAELAAEVTVQEKVEFGKPGKGIVDQAKKDGADMIVISTHGRTGLSHILLGSVTEKVVREATCPVLSIRPPRLKKEKTGVSN
jgi:universal stress protein A